MLIQKVTDQSFAEYGRVVTAYDCTRLMKEMEHTPLPQDVIYVPSVEELEALPIAKEFQNRSFGGLPIQMGYCNGDNKMLNALEYHRSSEFNVAITDMILMVGRQQDISTEFQYETDKVEAFLVLAGSVIEMYATTLHYAPCTVKEGGFKCVVILPKETNTELNAPKETEGEDKLLTLKNKWLIAHKDAKIEDAYNGLIGENISL